MNNWRKIVLITIELLILLFLILFNIIPKKIQYFKYDKYNEQVLSDLIYDGKQVNQTFISKYNSKSFSIRIGTYRHFYENGVINLKIDNLTNNTSKNIKIFCSSLNDREDTIINYPLKKNNRYSINITTTDISNKNGFVFYSTIYNNNDNYRLIIDGKEQDYNLIVGYTKYTYSKSNFWVIILYASVNFCIFSLYIKERR
ncbi:MAG: hypothetical protein IKE73_00950 [Bacilli bacterium]|nr:hypothetical protein [Bacilli bacterium]